MSDDREAVRNFIAAVESDEYAEVELKNGDTLVTDWEGDGHFHPYIVPAEGVADTLADDADARDERGADIATLIHDVFNVYVNEIEWVHDASVAHVYFEQRPTHEVLE